MRRSFTASSRCCPPARRPPARRRPARRWCPAGARPRARRAALLPPGGSPANPPTPPTPTNARLQLRACTLCRSWQTPWAVPDGLPWLSPNTAEFLFQYSPAPCFGERSLSQVFRWFSGDAPSTVTATSCGYTRGARRERWRRTAVPAGRRGAASRDAGSTCAPPPMPGPACLPGPPCRCLQATPSCRSCPHPAPLAGHTPGAWLHAIRAGQVWCVLLKTAP